MANANYIWRGAVEPRERTSTGNSLNLYRGAVEPQAVGDSVSSKLEGSSIFSIDVNVTGRVQERQTTYLKQQDGELLQLQDGGYLTLYDGYFDSIGGTLRTSISLTGVLSP